MSNLVPPYQQFANAVYQQYAEALATTQMQQPVGAAIINAFAQLRDYLIDRFRQSIKVKLPSYAPVDALTEIGAERLLPQGTTEASVTYAARLKDAWNSWPWAGTALGLLRVFDATGYSNVVIAQPNGGKLFSLDVNNSLVTNVGSGWVPTYIGDPFWSRFDVLFPAPLPAGWGGGSSVPTSSSNEANFIRGLISTWKPAHATCKRIIIVKSGKIYGYPISQVWGAATGNWGSSTEDIWTP